MENISELNHGVWSTRRIASSYNKKAHVLFPVEHTILDMLAAELSQGRLLDIGIGAGRTTAQVKDLCRDYVGIDYSAEMTGRARARFPSLDLRVMDARNLSAFESESFDIVMFSYNGIDYMAHDDRLKILREINRVLRPEGVFIFSTHNRDSGVKAPTSLKNLALTANPAGLPKSIARYALGLFNSARVKKLERQEDEYALLNDDEARYLLLTYYISLDAQVAQLERNGFGKVRVFSLDGRELIALGKRSPDASDYMLHFVARKTTSAQNAQSGTLPLIASSRAS